MATIGLEVIRAVLDDLNTRQDSIEAFITKQHTEEELVELVHAQSKLIKSTTELFNQMF